jgi:hypothetical protein
LGLLFHGCPGNAIGGGAPTYLAGVAPGTFAARRLIEKISRAPAPSHVLARSELDLLTMVCKFALYQLNRQSEAYAREDVGLPLSALCGAAQDDRWLSARGLSIAMRFRHFRKAPRRLRTFTGDFGTGDFGPSIGLAHKCSRQQIICNTTPILASRSAVEARALAKNERREPG